ncbi:hypothetical protein F4604DRAFT_1686316 [Suillus subluteus]|nr:hypothetical protein F4604DRAFT_1686316 [Suillus subluteus]
MMITKCQVLRPESRGPGAGTQDSVNILEITESQLLSSSCQDSGLPAPGSQELGLSDLQYVHLSEINKCAGNPESRQPELRSWDSVNILEITDSQLLSSGCRDSGLPAPRSQDAGVGTRCRQPGVPAAGTQESGVGDLQNVHLSEIKKCEHFGDHQLPAPEFWLPGLQVAGTWESGLGTRDSVLATQSPSSQNSGVRSEHIGDHRVPSPESRLPGAGNPESRQPELGSEDFGDYRVPTPEFRLPGLRVAGTGESGMNILEITDSQLPTPGCRQPGVPAAGTQESGVTTW